MSPIIMVLLVAALMLLTLAGASFYFYNEAVARKPKKFLNNNEDLQRSNPEEAWDSAAEWLKEQDIEEEIIKAYDGLTLRGVYIKAKVPTDRTVILAHGYSATGSSMGGFAKFYYEALGYNILMPDNRGHGSSGGNYIGFGWHDRRDCLSWIHYIISKTGANSQIVLHGVSMGGAAVLMTSGEALPENVKCIISDCAYTSAKDILSYQMRRMYRLPPFPLIQLTSVLCYLRAGYYFGEASAVHQVAKTKLPILFIHGGKDTFVPTEMVHRLYKQCNSQKELLLIPEAGHGNAFFVDKKSYGDKVISFINNYAS
jgi:uncharacterized protein